MFGEFNLNTFYIISQVFALLSIIFDLIAAQRRKKYDLLKMDTLAAFCSSLHYAFLGAWSGLISKVVTTARNGIAAYEAKNKRKNNKWLPVVFITLYIILGVITFDSPFSVLPILAPSIYTIVIYNYDASVIRYAIVVTAIIWLIYDIHVLSIVGIVADIIITVNGLIAIYRYRKKQKTHLRR